MYTALVHIANEEAFLADLEQLPAPTDSVLVVTNARKKDGKPFFIKNYIHSAGITSAFALFLPYICLIHIVSIKGLV